MNIDASQICQNYLNIIYHDIQIQDKSDKIAESYGEILYPSIEKLLRILALSENDIFVDLGSGMGKVVLQIFLKSRVKQAYGIEILPQLHQRADQIAKRVKSELPDFFIGDRQLDFLCGDFLKIPLEEATVLFVNSICFSQQILSELEARINHSPRVHTVLSMRPFHGLKKLFLKATIPVECSWDSALCYVYSV